MKSFLLDLLKRLTSRKFLLTIGTAFILIANKQYTELVLLIGAYVGVEGVGDAAARYSAPKAVAAQASLNEAKLTFDALENPDTGVDKSSFVAGSSMAGQ